MLGEVGVRRRNFSLILQLPLPNCLKLWAAMRASGELDFVTCVLGLGLFIRKVLSTFCHKSFFWQCIRILEGGLGLFVYGASVQGQIRFVGSTGPTRTQFAVLRRQHLGGVSPPLLLTALPGSSKHPRLVPMAGRPDLEGHRSEPRCPSAELGLAPLGPNIARPSPAKVCFGPSGLWPHSRRIRRRRPWLRRALCRSWPADLI